VTTRWRLYLADAAVAVAVTVAYLNLAAIDEGPPLFAGPAWLGWVVAAGVGLPLALRRRWPLAVLAAVLAALTVASLLDITREPYLPAAFALYAVGLLCPIRTASVALGAALLVAAGGLFVAQVVVTPSEAVPGAAELALLVGLFGAGAWAAGVLNRRRRAEAALAHERGRAEAVAAERLRIARELHDLVSHNLSLIAVQAGTANHVAAEHPDRALGVLRDIEATSRRALAEMRSMLGILRHGGEPGCGPAPGLVDLAGLAEATRAAGLPVELEQLSAVDAPVDPPAGVQLAVYRIVQEALTNVARHAGPARCIVRIHLTTDQVSVEVLDDGHGAGTAEPGHGLIGMRERVSLYGGTLRAGTRPGGGYAVRATLTFGHGPR
jgi:signal transduction histidine kinase